MAQDGKIRSGKPLKGKPSTKAPKGRKMDKAPRGRSSGKPENLQKGRKG